MMRIRAEHRPWLALGALVVAGAALRLVALDAGLWFDEVVTYLRYARLPYREILTTYDSQNQHTLYSLLAHTAFLAFGESGWALRLPAALFGVTSIPALYLLGREVAGPSEALLATALMVFSYHHIWFSQNARGYTGILFFTLLTGWLLVRALRKPQLGTWLAYALAAALGVFTHLTVLFIIGGHGLTVLLHTLLSLRRRGGRLLRREDVTLPLAGFAAAGVLILLLYAPVLPHLLGGEAAVDKVDAVASAWKSPLWTLLELVRGLQVGFAGGLVAVIAALFAAVGAWDYVRLAPGRAPVLLELLVFPVVINAAAIIGLYHHVWPRFFFFGIGFGMLLLVRGALVLGRALGRGLRLDARRGAQVAIALPVLLILASAASVPAVYGPKQDYEGALAYVTGALEPGDRVVVAGLAALPYREFYRMDWQEVDSLDSLAAARNNANRIWLLYTLPIHLRANYPELAREIDRDFRVVREFPGTLNDGEVVLCLAEADTNVATNETD